MRLKSNMQAGFSVVEGLVIVVVLVAVAGAGYFALNRASKDDTARNTSTTSQQPASKSSSEATPEAPEITTTDDLEGAQKTLDGTDLNGKDSELDTQLDAF